ncbi:unnamed protein product [Vitrella brassicaformis CCMP3155]|uniref:Uncharacterized protein n=1 Tax=Vitrella brassicaformis (strain CCMP3155) TaxID=1169540 RepID=A0A0G4G6N9_VITBC|nr:unnamed protein product [Vitrella brassicaformis CCMP3155]|eukprot:CEM24372.1 unnamed protein product [Vitrella brassicaformis CCMP3155]
MATSTASNASHGATGSAKSSDLMPLLHQWLTQERQRFASEDTALITLLDRVVDRAALFIAMAQAQDDGQPSSQQPMDTELLMNALEYFIDQLMAASDGSHAPADTRKHLIAHVRERVELLGASLRAADDEEGESEAYETEPEGEGRLSEQPQHQARAADGVSEGDREPESEGGEARIVCPHLSYLLWIRVFEYLHHDELEAPAIACSGLCAAINLNLFYMYLVMRVLRFLLVGPSDDIEDDDEQEGQQGG